MTDIATATQAAGVVAAHSGTYLAILIDANGGQHHAQVAACRKNLTELGLLQKCGLQLEIRWVSQKHPVAPAFADATGAALRSWLREAVSAATAPSRNRFQ